MEEEDGELLERRAKFPGNFTKLLMEREIHGGKRKYKFPGQTYQHHYQLFASAKPQIACELELNKIDNVRENGSQFGHLAECLGFSPDGRYLAFLSHGRTAISILRYSGVKNGPPADDEAGVERMFEHAEIFNMNNLPGYNSAQRESVEASWWTDDSSTLIVQLKFRKWLEDDDDQEENEENEGLAEANRLDAMGEHMEAVAAEEAPPPSVSFQEEEEDPRDIIPIEQRSQSSLHYELNGLPGAGDSRRRAEAIDAEDDDSEISDLNNAYDSDEIEETGSEIEKMRDIVEKMKAQNGNIEEAGTSRSATSTNGVENLMTQSPSSERPDQCSRTMPIYEVVVSETDQAPSPQFKNWLMQKVKESDRLNPKFAALDKIAVSLRKRWKKPRKFTPAGLFQEVVEATEKFSSLDFVHLRAPADHRKSFMFVAYDVRSGQICPVTFNNSCGKFHCHVRDRSLTVVYNNDFIETFRIARDTSTWQRVWQTRLSTRYGSPCPLRYRFDTVPGHACLLDAPLIGDPLKLLYDTSKFHTPIAQDAKSLLWRDQPEWFAAYETIRENEPVITRCHLIDDDLLALTVSYFFGSLKTPIHQGIAIRLSDDTLNIFPNYHEYLKHMFTHHLAELFPRQYTYLSAHPIHLQPWFHDYFVNPADSAELDNFSRLKSNYDLMYVRLDNNKSISNPFLDSQYYDDEGSDVMTNYAYTRSEMCAYGLFELENSPKFADKFFHPHDPLFIYQVGPRWLAAVPKRDEKNVIW